MKKFFRFYTISDWVEEEEWLREQSKKGFKLCKLNPPVSYSFEETEPEDVIYKLEYKNAKAEFDCNSMYQDYGWEYCGSCLGWNYYRKPASQINSENDGELFSDKESKIEMLERIIKTRMLPLVTIFFCCLIPSFGNLMRLQSKGIFDYIFVGLFTFLFFFYIYLFIHCGRKLRAMKKNLSE